ncbi:MAG: RNA chaperone Hfq [Thermofilaceae archaeon]
MFTAEPIKNLKNHTDLNRKLLFQSIPKDWVIIKKGGSKMTQDQFLDLLRRNRIKTTVYLINGIRYEGFIVSSDKFTIIVENERQQAMLYKSALSAVIPSKKINLANHNTKATNNKNLKPHKKQKTTENSQEASEQTESITEEWYKEETQE